MAAPSANASRAWVAVLLALPYLGLCFPQMYARATPALFGFPFFYWYQFAWVVLTSLLLMAVYRRLKDALNPRCRIVPLTARV